MQPRKTISIARVIARLNVGGPAIQAILMTDIFNRRGFPSLLLTGEVPPGEASMEYLAAEKDVTPIKLDCMSRRISVSKDLLTLFRLWRTFRRKRPTIVHTHTAKAGTLGRLAAIMARVPIRVHTFHGHVFRGYFSKPATAAFIVIERMLAHFTDRIITVSNSQKEELCNEFKIASREKIDVINLGFDLQPFLEVNGPRNIFRRSLPAPVQRPLVAWVGRFAPVKAPDLLLSAAAECSPDLAYFVMVGDGELRASCESRISHRKLESHVRIVGWHRDLPDVYSDVDIVVLTSHNEGTPVALLEAMASRRPFISTLAGGVRDLMIGEPRAIAGMQVFRNGVLVPREPSVIATAIRYLLERPAVRELMGSAGREFVRSKFSAHRLADDLEGLYLRLANEKGIVATAKSPFIGVEAPTPAMTEYSR